MNNQSLPDELDAPAPCDRCGGTGTVHVTIYGGHDVDCGACRGTGRSPEGTTPTAPSSPGPEPLGPAERSGEADIDE